MKNIIPIILAIALTNMSCGKSKKEEPVTIEQENQNVEQSQASKPEEQMKEVGVITTEYGDLIVDFFEDSAPKHVESFKLHAENGFYDGTIFHRVIPGFMIQGGDLKEKIKRAMVLVGMLQNTMA